MNEKKGGREIERSIFEPEYALSKNLVELSRKDLCALVAEICRQIKAESGSKAYHGGIYPENISCNPDGKIGIGPARKSDWGEQELKYIAPEIYWNNKPCPQSDVYSLGLLLYYGASEGKLPFEGESSNAQLMRMSGKTVYAPAAAGTHLGDIIEKALRFKENERYRTPEELAVMLDYCEDNRLLKAKSGAEAIFRKDEEQLSDLEQMMLQIIEGNEEADPTETEQDGRDPDSAAEPVRKDTAESEQTEDELFAEAGLTRPEKKNHSEEDKVSLADIFGLDEPDPRDPTELDEEEEIRVYEPKGKQGIPILTEEKEPELAPITVKKKKAGSGREKAEESEQKRRPLLVVLMLLAVLVIAAVVANILINAFSDRNGGRIPSGVSVVTPSSEPTQDPTVSAILSEEQIRRQQELAEQQAREQELAEQQALAEQQQAEIQAQQQEVQPTVDPATLPHTYEAIRADVGWLEAQQAAIERGGQLVTINSAEELQQVIDLATQAGFDRIWIGAHRVNGDIVWESGESVDFYQWDTGEPSYTDSGDGAVEDYVMLWNLNGKWVYNDSRENPLTNFYGMYGGRTGYVVEYVG